MRPVSSFSVVGTPTSCPDDSHEAPTVQKLVAAIEKNDLNTLTGLLDQLSPDDVSVTTAKPGADEKTLLHIASALGNGDIVLALLPWFMRAPGSLSAFDKNYYTALKYAAENSHVNVVEMLVTRGANGENELLKAWLNGKTDTARTLIEAGVHIPLRVIERRSTEELRLLLSLGYGSAALEDLGKILTRKGARALVNAGIGATDAVFKAATEMRSASGLKRLGAAGMDVPAAYFRALESNDTAPLSFLYDCRINDARAMVQLAKEGNTAALDRLMQAGHGGKNMLLVKTVQANDNPLLRRLLDTRQWDLELRDRHNMTALAIASKDGNVEAIKLLCDAGADLEAECFMTNCTAISFAAEYDRADAVAVLCQYEANLEHRDSRMRTAVFVAAESGGGNAIRALHAGGAALNDADLSGHTPLMAAAFWGRPTVIKSLFECGVNLNEKASDYGGKTALTIAAQYRKWAAVDRLIELGADPNVAESDGTTALANTAYHGNCAVIAQLIKAGADVDAADFSLRKTALSIAADRCNWAAVSVLIELGADPNVAELDGTAALMTAAFHGNTTVLLELIAAGADVNAVNEDNWTALMFAAEGNHYHAVSCLLQKGANIGIQTHDGQTALSISMGADAQESQWRLSYAAGNDTSRAILPLSPDFHSEQP